MVRFIFFKIPLALCGEWTEGGKVKARLVGASAGA